MSDRQEHLSLNLSAGLSPRPKFNPVWLQSCQRSGWAQHRRCEAIARHTGERCKRIALTGVHRCQCHGGDRLQRERKARLEAVGAWPDKALQAALNRRRKAKARKAMRRQLYGDPASIPEKCRKRAP